MTVEKMFGAFIVATGLFIAATTAALHAAEPETRPTSGPSETALAEVTGRDALLAAEVQKAYAVIVIPRFSPTDGEPGRGEIYVGGKVFGRAMLQSASLGDNQTAFTEIVLIKDKKTLDSVIDAGLKFDQDQAATMAAGDGKEQAAYKDGIAVFCVNKGDDKTVRSVAGQMFAVKAIPTTRSDDNARI